MKNLFLIVFTLFFGMSIFSSCEKDVVKTKPAIDYITLLDKKGEVLDEYQYDQNEGRFIGGNADEKGIVIHGTVLAKEENDDGGHNYYCVSSSDVCYAKK